jgi:peptidoglycan-N-acetylglucosamine deacetylase
MSRYNLASTAFLVLLITSLGLDGILNVPLWWYIAITVIYFLAVTYGVIFLSASFFVPVISHGNKTGIALTFDDGPIAKNTERILDILQRYNVPATFFCIGNRVEARPEIVKRIDAEGHLIGNHTYWHGSLFDLKSSPMVLKELYDTDVAIMKAIGKRPKFFRPPYGVTNPMIANAVRRSNYRVIGWSIRSFDTMTKDPDKLFRRITRSLKTGDVILLHDYPDSTLIALPRLLDHIQKLGLKVVRVDELINERGYA